MSYLKDIFVKQLDYFPTNHLHPKLIIFNNLVNIIKIRFTITIAIVVVINVIFLIPFCRMQIAWTQDDEFSDSLNIKSIPLPTGSGARALGQGGAFIAVADDATAASWNPAGLIQLEKPEASFVGSYLTTDQDFSVRDEMFPATFRSTLDNEDVGRWDINFISAAYPFRFLGKNFVTALNYHQIFDFHTDINFNQLQANFERSLYVSSDIDFKSSGGVGALSPSIGFQLLPELALGLTVNIFDDEFFNSHAWTETLFIKDIALQSGRVKQSSFKRKISSRDYHGANVSLGMMWNIWEREEKQITLGAVFHSPYTARFDRETKEWFKINRSLLNNFPQRPGKPQKSRIKMDWPMSVGVGIGVRLSDALSFSFDITWEDWSEWTQKTKKTETGSVSYSRPIGNGSKHDEIDDTFSTRFGTEYLMFLEKDVLAFRGGLFFEQRPSLGASDFDENFKPVNPDGDPTDVLGFSLGAGYSTERFSIDAAYQFRYVRDMEGGDIGVQGTVIDTKENLFLASFILYM